MWQAISSNAGQFSNVMNIAMLPFQIGQNNAQAAEAVYKQEMERWQQAEAAKANLHSELQNMSNIKAGRILSDLEIEANQRKAEAEAKVSAAAAGVTGGTVKQVIQSTEINKAIRKGDVATATENALNQSLENIYGFGRDVSLATQPAYKSDAMKHMMRGIFGISPINAALWKAVD